MAWRSACAACSATSVCDRRVRLGRPRAERPLPGWPTAQRDLGVRLVTEHAAVGARLEGVAPSSASRALGRLRGGLPGAEREWWLVDAVIADALSG